MKTKLIVSLFLCVTVSVKAEISNWINTGNGDWFNDANWDFSVPASTGTAVIDNGGTTLINSGTAWSLEGKIGENVSSAVTISGNGVWKNQNNLTVGANGHLAITGNGKLVSGFEFDEYGSSMWTSSIAGSVTVSGSGLWQNGRIATDGATLTVTGNGTLTLWTKLLLPLTVC